jgi:hypothetical protein
VEYQGLNADFRSAPMSLADPMAQKRALSSAAVAGSAAARPPAQATIISDNRNVGKEMFESVAAIPVGERRLEILLAKTSACIATIERLEPGGWNRPLGARPINDRVRSFPVIRRRPPVACAD